MKLNFGVRFFIRKSWIAFNSISILTAKIFRRSRFLVRFDTQLIYAPTNVEGGLRRSILKGVYENDERIIIRRFLDSEDAVIEFGGAIGVLACTYGKTSSKHHLTLEPNPEIAEILRLNLERAQMSNVQLIEAAAHWDDGTCQFHVNDDFYSSSMTSQNGREITVARVDVNKLIEKHCINTIVSDVEGFEYSLFKNIDLAPIKKIVVEIHEVEDTGPNVSELLTRLQKEGFKFAVRSWRGNVLVFGK